MFRARIEDGTHLCAAAGPVYDFGVRDFTVAAMVVSRRGGVILARAMNQHHLPAIGGFLLVINPDGRVKFETVRGIQFHRAVSEPTKVLDGECHTLAAMRSGGKLSIFLDGVSVPVTEERDPNSTGPLNVDNGRPLMIGHTEYAFEPYRTFNGEMMNVSIWSAALSPALMLSAAFARISGREAKGKIFHCYTCFIGEEDTPSGPALGRELVRRGAVAFFGYRRPVAFPKDAEQRYLGADAYIDLELMAGETCKRAYEVSMAEYKNNVRYFESIGKYYEAAWLEWNQHGLVSPSTDPAFGNENARLKVKTGGD